LLAPCVFCFETGGPFLKLCAKTLRLTEISAGKNGAEYIKQEGSKQN
jgi:hypothetical protein